MADAADQELVCGGAENNQAKACRVMRGALAVVDEAALHIVNLQMH